jgi:hypothetical protein
MVESAILQIERPLCRLTCPERCRLKTICKIADQQSVEVTARQRINFEGVIHDRCHQMSRCMPQITLRAGEELASATSSELAPVNNSSCAPVAKKSHQETQHSHHGCEADSYFGKTQEVHVQE